jgi:hypothetical protein
VLNTLKVSLTAKLGSRQKVVDALRCLELSQEIFLQPKFTLQLNLLSPSKTKIHVTQLIAIHSHMLNATS